MDTVILIALELINVSAADLLLVGLVGVFFFSGLGYKIKANSEISRLKSEVGKVKGTVEEMASKEKSLRDQVHDLLSAQSLNMVEINRLKTKKENLGKFPITLSKELEGIIAWCHQKKISVNFERRMAAKRPTPKGKTL
tara:strand:- start:207 stop:623 length:417 start_codon:yes stop_codon:yes gene_type:complete